MTLAQRRRRRVELLIDQRLVGFLKPMMSVSVGPGKDAGRHGRVTELNAHKPSTRGERAS